MDTFIFAMFVVAALLATGFILEWLGTVRSDDPLGCENYDEFDGEADLELHERPTDCPKEPPPTSPNGGMRKG